MPDHPSPIATPEGLQAAFDRTHAASRRDMMPPLAERRRRLDALEALLQDHRDRLADAVAADFGHRSRHETRLLEFFPTLEGIRHARRHLQRWMAPRRRPVALWFQPGRAELRPQPLGCVGIISPWNYPIYLAAGPLTAAFAAGNRALLKMSEFTPATAATVADLVSRYFSADELAVVGGDQALAAAFAALPFDHLLFTGSTAVGRQVMQAAAANLTPVTLELGGKSPALVAPDYPVAAAAARILAGKCLNAGQTCIAPDYVLLPAAALPAFIDAARHLVGTRYPDLAANPDYSAIVNERHWKRLNALLDDARARGAEIVPLSAGGDAERRRLPPTLILDPRDDMRVMQEEIFGPLLPVLTYRRLDEALAYINRHDRPLALYLFDRDRARIRRVLDTTMAGGITINDTILHIAQDELPFGGVGPSGMGHYHGRAGFDAFSKLKPVFHQSRLNAMRLFDPPYGARFDRLLKVLLR
ncbi:coniferyl aldehyde dehydrogenase [uncultured Dechloromonas sp.]|uniref:coniferyl aldehyde dehydrogenase n=1 Tax=uncultured Dechloromonas sp. TaxID=171719 RepID=UPI0025F3875C|nr:coniferyl aldehyde dehydrogenase [uncultured Dechloromonas sp.]